MKKYKSVEEMIEDLHKDWTTLDWIEYYFYRVIEHINPKKYYREVKWFIQRGIRGYSDRDTWNLDYFLADVISKSVSQLQKDGMGYPRDITEKEWHNILRKISYAFYFYNKCEEEIEPTQYSEQKRKELLTEAFNLLNERFGNLWD